MIIVVDTPALVHRITAILSVYFRCVIITRNTERSEFNGPGNRDENNREIVRYSSRELSK